MSFSFILFVCLLSFFLRPTVAGSTVDVCVPNSPHTRALQPAAVGRRKEQSFAAFCMYLLLILYVGLWNKVLMMRALRCIDAHDKVR